MEAPCIPGVNDPEGSETICKMWLGAYTSGAGG